MFSTEKLVLGIACISIFLNDVCFSAVFNVTTGADSGAGSFRQAITDLNAGSDPSNTITFNSNYSITLGSDLPVIQKPVTITGASAEVDGGNSFRGLVFNAQTTDVIQVTALTIKNALSKGGQGGSPPANGSGGGGGAGLGGGVCAIQGQIILDTISLETNRAVGGNGGNSSSVAGTNIGGGGGGAVTDGNGNNGGNGYDGVLSSNGGSQGGSGGSGFGGGSGGSNQGSTAPNGGIGGGGGGGARNSGTGGSSLFGSVQNFV